MSEMFDSKSNGIVNNRPFAASLRIFSIAVFATAGVNTAIAQKTPNSQENPTVVSAQSSINPSWIKEFEKGGITKEQRKTWPAEKLEALREWKEQLDAANQEKTSTDKGLTAANQRLIQEGKGLDAVNQDIGRLAAALSKINPR